MSARDRLASQLRRLGLMRSGHVERFDTKRVIGWVTNARDPDDPVSLTLHVDGKPELSFLADRERQDVQASGRGPLHCGFDVAVPRRVSDGQAHLLELRLTATGKLVRGGSLRLAGAEMAAARGGASVAAEGVAFFDSGRQQIKGWALGADHVVLRLDQAVETIVPLDRGVPGFGNSVLAGFAWPIPDHAQDGKPHLARVRFGSGSTELDGSPISFTCMPPEILVDLVGFADRRAEFRLLDGKGRPVRQTVVARIDGQAATVQATDQGILLYLPEGASEVALETASGTRLAHFVLRGGMLTEPMQPAARIPSARTLERARQAFASFCAQPDRRFDPSWYRGADPEAGQEDDPARLLALYRDSGARRGIAPNGFFDEAGLRRSTPELAMLVETGDLPCLFALELVPGEDRLPGFLHVAPYLQPALTRGEAGVEDLARKIDRAGAPIRRMPVPAMDRSARDSIYAAWLSRLLASPEQLEEIAEDDRAISRELAASALRREPLISIIMPSWNRAFAIGEAIQSVLEQSYPNWELIVCDDASEDNTAEVVRGFDDPRIRYNCFVKSNGAGARNGGLRLARGEYIAYLDSDNIWHPSFLDLMMRRLLASPGSQMAYSAILDTEITGATVRLEQIARASFRPIPLSSRNYIDLNSLVHHRNLFDWLGGFDADLPRLQDWDLLLRYTSVFRPLFVDRIGVFYRRNLAWGQVTHVFAGSNAQAIVNEKKQRRLGGEQVRLRIPHHRGQLTVLPLGDETGQFRPQDLILAVHLAQGAAAAQPVDLILPEACSLIPEDMPGLLLHRMAPDSLRDEAALGSIVSDRPVLGIGAAPRAGHRLFPELTFVLGTGVEGGQFRNLADDRVVFSTGPVPLLVPRIDRSGQRMLVLTGDAHGMDLPERLARDRRREILVAPRGAKGWQMTLGDGQLYAAPVDDGGLAHALAEVSIVAALALPEALSPLSRALLAACQAQGIPVMMPDDRATRPDGFAAQWIESRAVVALDPVSVPRLVEMAAKVLRNPALRASLEERSRICHAITDDSRLFRERLAWLAMQAATEPLEVDVIFDASRP